MSATDRPRRMGPLHRETIKLLAQKRTYIGAGLLTLFPIAMAVLIELQSNPHGDQGAGGPLFLRMLTESGLYMPLATLFMLETILLPIAAAMVGGFLIAGEAESGTLRTVLLRPVRRGSMLLAKWVVGMGYLAFVLVLLTVVSLIAGGLLFGIHPVMSAPTMEGPVLDMRMVQVPVADALVKIVLADLFVVVFLGVFLSLALFISTLTDSSLTATMVAVVLTVVIHAVMQFSYLDDIRPYWFWTRFTDWYGLFLTPVDWGLIVRGLLVFGAYTLVALAAAWYAFRRKDILS